MELGLGYQAERIGYKVSVYYNHFKNYIYNENLFRENQLFMRRYNQAKARFYGVEAEQATALTTNTKPRFSAIWYEAG